MTFLIQFIHDITLQTKNFDLILINNHKSERTQLQEHVFAPASTHRNYSCHLHMSPSQKSREEKWLIRKRSRPVCSWSSECFGGGARAQNTWGLEVSTAPALCAHSNPALRSALACYKLLVSPLRIRVWHSSRRVYNLLSSQPDSGTTRVHVELIRSACQPATHFDVRFGFDSR